MQTYTNDELLDNIRLRALLPQSQNLYTADRLLMLANDELQTVIFPMMMLIKGDYFVHMNVQTMNNTLVYDIPGDAVGIKIKDVYWRNPDWPTTQPDVLIPLINYQDYTNQAAGLFNYLAYFIRDNSVHLTHIRQGQELHILYYKRAYKLVQNEEGAQVVDASTPNIIVNDLPHSWIVGDILTLTSQNPPFPTISTTLEITGITFPNILNLLQTDPSAPVFTIQKGDWLTQSGETVIAQITPEAHAILAQSVACKCLEGMNDPGLPSSQSKFQQLYDAFIQAMTPRTDGQAKKIVQRNGTLFWGKVNRGYIRGGGRG